MPQIKLNQKMNREALDYIIIVIKSLFCIRINYKTFPPSRMQGRMPEGFVPVRSARNTDNARTWTVLGTISDPGSDLDNGQMIQLPNGDILLAARSVRWAESFYLPVYKSTNGGATWTYLSNIDSNAGGPGTLGARGVYEPHFGYLADGRLAVTSNNSKLSFSNDYGATWYENDQVLWPGGFPDFNPCHSRRSFSADPAFHPNTLQRRRAIP